MSTLPPVAEMNRACARRDAAYDGLFYFAVRTTGVFCRPTCPARAARPANVEYFASADEALAAGYRPCRRCRPLEPDGEPAWAGALLDEIERDPARRITDGDLAARGIDPATVRRHFRRHFGMSFQAYARARRLAGALQQIQQGAALDDAVLESGYGSHSGFRDAFVRAFGDPPGRSRGRECVFVLWLESPLGPLVAGSTTAGVCLLEFAEPPRLDQQLATLRKLFGTPLVPGRSEHLEQLETELAEYFAGRRREFSVPLHQAGTVFQRRVWGELRQIPYGETRSYEDLALALGVPGGQRAVGRANGQNRIAIVIPCHRVVNKNGRLGGYGGGLRRKEFLLELERRHEAGRDRNGTPRQPNSFSSSTASR